MYRGNKKTGFTLVEILIVVIILGILAAIVIPQFTNASTEARWSSTASLLQTLRSQIELYKLQHGDTLPDLTVAAPNTWDQLTTQTTYGGNNFGPYMQQVPKNPMNAFSAVADGDGTAAPVAGTGFVYDYNGGAGTGKLWATTNSGTTAATMGDLYFDESNPGVGSATAP